MTTWSLVWLFLGGSVATFLSALATKSFTEISWHELHEFCHRRKRDLLFDQIHDESDDVSLAADTLHAVGVGLMMLAAIGLYVGDSPMNKIAVWDLPYVVVIAAAVFFVISVWLPREVARWWGHIYLFHTWRIWRLSSLVLKPLGFFSYVFNVMLVRMSGRKEDDPEEEKEDLEDEIRSIVTEGHHDGLMEADVREMIEGIIELDNVDVADIMTPLTDMDSIEVSRTWRDILDFVVECGRTRIPVYEKDKTNIVGTLYVKDLLSILSHEQHSPVSLESLLREPWHIPLTTKVDELLKQFLRGKNHQAIVIDEFGNTRGLVTIEDVLEEIVGEIVDESDKESESPIQQLSETEAIIHARTHIYEVNDLLRLDLPDDGDFDTLGGFVISQLGHIPKVGENVLWQSVQITVTAASKRRVERLQVIVLDEETVSDQARSSDTR